MPTGSTLNSPLSAARRQEVETPDFAEQETRPGGLPTEVQHFRCFADITATVVTKPAKLLEGEPQVIVDVDPVTGRRTNRTQHTITERTTQEVTGIVPISASYRRRNHQQCGELELTVAGSALPFPPLAIMGCAVRLYMGLVHNPNEEAKVSTSEIRAEKNLRAIGYADQYTEKLGEKGPEVTFRCRDLTALFFDFKPVPAEAIPLYTDTLREAVGKIIRVVTQPFEDARLPRPINLQEIPDAFDPPLNAAAHHRGATGHVIVDPNASAWAVILHVCGLVSATPRVYLDELRIEEPPESHGAVDTSAYSFVFGEETANILSIERTRKFQRNRRPVAMTCFDPEARAVIYARWPPKDQELRHTRPLQHLGNRVQRHRRSTSSTSHSGRTRTVTPPKDNADYFAAPNGISSPDALLAACKKAYDERKLGDLEGMLDTPDLTDDLLGIQHGDRITIKVKPNLEAELIHTSSDARTVDLLARRLGMDASTLSILIHAMRQFQTALYFVRSLSVEYRSDGKSSASIEFLKLIDITESSSP